MTGVGRGMVFGLIVLDGVGHDVEEVWGKEK